MTTPRKIIDAIWDELTVGIHLPTPDDSLRTSYFEIAENRDDSITIMANMRTPITINRESFVAAIEFLQQRNATRQNPIDISSSNSNTGDNSLCAATKAANGGTRVITYIAPLLCFVGATDIIRNRRNQLFLV